MGNLARFTDLQDWCYTGRPCSMHCYGNGLESISKRERRILCHSRRHQLGVADHPLRPIFPFVHTDNRRWQPRQNSCLISRCCHFSPHCMLHFVSLPASPYFLQYLGIPLAAGIVTRYSVWYFTSKEFLTTRFLPWFSPLALLGLLYTILVMFAYQGHHIIGNLGPVFRVFVPMILYFVIMWSSSFATVYYLSRKQVREETFGYEMAVVQAFTAGSNNFVSATSLQEANQRLTFISLTRNWR